MKTHRLALRGRPPSPRLILALGGEPFGSAELTVEARPRAMGLYLEVDYHSTDIGHLHERWARSGIDLMEVIVALRLIPSPCMTRRLGCGLRP